MADNDDEIIQDSTIKPAKQIQAIDRASVHRICSGQVVLNLATAVKELVENSLDAGATCIEIRLKEYGSELIEVTDNGSGVEETNFEGLTLKHHTSKLQDFTDLVNVETFGFRGEALSSLCALSNLSVITRHKDATVATKLEYDNNGKLLKCLPCARQTGTTVIIQNVFSTLPVRYKEFQRNVKKEFAKMVQILNAYCIISTGVKLSCTNQVSNGKKNIVVSTNNNPSIKENITNIFGNKQFQSLLQFKQLCPTESVCEEFGVKKVEDKESLFKLTGYVSSSEHGLGRSSSDRQFYFINHRPCDPTKISRLVNDVYRSYNKHQHPFVMLDISLNKDGVDVNVTPDKRQIFFQEEKQLLATIKESLIRLFEPQCSLYNVSQAAPAFSSTPNNTGLSTQFTPKFTPTNNLSLKKNFSCPAQNSSSKTSLSGTLGDLKRSFSSSFAKEDSTPTSSSHTPKQRRLDSFISVFDRNRRDTPSSASFLDIGDCDTTDLSFEATVNRNLSSATVINHAHCDPSHKPDQPSSPKSTDSTNCVLLSVQSPGAGNASDVQASTGEIHHTVDNTHDSLAIRETMAYGDDVIPTDSVIHVDSVINENKEADSNHCVTACDPNRTKCENIRQSVNTEDGTVCNGIDNEMVTVTDNDQIIHTSAKNLTSSALSLLSSQSSKHSMTPPAVSLVTSASFSTSISVSSTTSPREEEEISIIYDHLDQPTNQVKKTVTVPFSMKSLRCNMCSKQKSQTDNKFCRSFRAKITPGDNESAEDELKKEIRKEHFKEIQILGQFNLGFIVGQLGEDLFIIDQHATDEKYNFEMLQRHTTIQSQKLILPQSLELTAVNELILMDNIEIFKKNGFEFIINEDASPTQRVKLTSIPMSKGWTFGKEDIEELIFMLTDSPGVMCRPSRIRLMFASRACRKSIMIGTALNSTEMKKLVHHMGEIDQPWNCPHGRPTMRHLINLNMLPK